MNFSKLLWSVHRVKPMMGQRKISNTDRWTLASQEHNRARFTHECSSFCALLVPFLWVNSVSTIIVDKKKRRELSLESATVYVSTPVSDFACFIAFNGHTAVPARQLVLLVAVCNLVTQLSSRESVIDIDIANRAPWPGRASPFCYPDNSCFKDILYVPLLYFENLRNSSSIYLRVRVGRAR